MDASNNRIEEKRNNKSLEDIFLNSSTYANIMIMKEKSSAKREQLCVSHVLCHDAADIAVAAVGFKTLLCLRRCEKFLKTHGQHHHKNMLVKCWYTWKKQPCSVLEMGQTQCVLYCKAWTEGNCNDVVYSKGHPESKRVVNPFTVARLKQHMKMQNSDGNNKR